MRDINFYENLLDDNKPAEVLEDLISYKGRGAKIYYLMAEARRMLGHFEEAIALYSKADSYNKLPAKAGAEEGEEFLLFKLDIALAMSKCYRTLGIARTAYETACRAFDLAKKQQFLDYAMTALQEMGMSLRAMGRLDEAAQLLKEVLSYYESEKDLAGISFIYWALGGICRLKGRFKEGIEYFKLAIKLAKRAKDKMAEAYGYCGLAGISRIAGDIKACVDNYKKAEAIFKNSEDIFGKAYTNCGMANGLRQLGSYDEALKRYKRADALYTAINDTVDLGFVKWGKADVLKRKNKLKEALAELKEAKELFASSDETRGQLLTEFSLAQLIYALGDAKTAESIYDAALKRCKKEGLYTYMESYT